MVTNELSVFCDHMLLALRVPHNSEPRFHAVTHRLDNAIIGPSHPFKIQTQIIIEEAVIVVAIDLPACVADKRAVYPMAHRRVSADRPQATSLKMVDKLHSSAYS